MKKNFLELALLISIFALAFLSIAYASEREIAGRLCNTVERLDEANDSLQELNDSLLNEISLRDHESLLHIKHASEIN